MVGHCRIGVNMRLRELIEADSGMGDIFGQQIDDIKKRDAEREYNRNRNTTNPFNFSTDTGSEPLEVDPERIGQGRVSYVPGFRQKTRNQPIDTRLMQVLQTAARETGVRVVIFSGGQTATRRTGSTRHDNGLAADIYVYDGQGKQLTTSGDDPLVVNFVAALKRAGAQGLGAHPGYMNGVGFHVDLWGSQKGGAMWGANGTGSPPRSIATAFRTGRGVDVA